MKFAPYSFSKINSFEMCPKKFDFNYIQKLGVWVPNLATERGSYIHTLLENDTKSKPTNFKFTLIDDEIQQECINVYEKFKASEWGQFFFDPEFDTKAEVAFGMKRTEEGLETCSYYDKEALFRGKIDHFMKDDYMIYVADWKTGKISGFPAPLQLIMYAVWALSEYPDIDTVITAFVYVEHPDDPDCVKEYTFKREHLPLLKKKVIEKIVNIEKAEKFQKKETKLCEYCEYRKKGLCDETSGEDFADQMTFGYTPKKDQELFSPENERELFYFIHPESSCAWIQDYNDPEEHDGLTEEIDAGMFYNLSDFGYDDRDIDKTIHTRDEK